MLGVNTTVLPLLMMNLQLSSELLALYTSVSKDHFLTKIYLPPEFLGN